MNTKIYSYVYNIQGMKLKLSQAWRIHDELWINETTYIRYRYIDIIPRHLPQSIKAIMVNNNNNNNVMIYLTRWRHFKSNPWSTKASNESVKNRLTQPWTKVWDIY